MDFNRIICSLPGIIIGFTVHEFFHAFAAYKLGDTTAKDQGRLTLDPIKHIDPIGLLFIVIAGFGWAKPVQFNPSALKHPKRDHVIIAAAGPLSNLVVGILLICIYKIIWFIPVGEESYTVIDYITDICFYSAFTNIGLFVFNMLPLPPLDGSHIFLAGLNLRPEIEQRIMQIGTPILFLIFILQSQTGINILPIGKIIRAIMSIFL
ncbi:MAG: site-2 protease family protein [Termitinemataceae bacterium]|nr:MAG: site-2 protease family protein [Termitinemataceae bacterium]